MARVWDVVLTKEGKQFDFGENFFPDGRRGFHYKTDAEILMDEIKRKGGESRLERVVPKRNR